jgi:hypothetical protein
MDTSRREWDWLGEQGERIARVLQSAKPGGHPLLRALDAWEAHLAATLPFPFAAVVAERTWPGEPYTGEKVRVHAITLVDDSYGVIVSVRYGRKKYDLPLCNLAASDETTGHAQAIDDYRAWFANY